MAGLLDNPTTAAPESAEASPVQAASPETAPPEAPEAPARSCATCSAPLAEGQDWCLECGSAQPGRLGGRPGWRAALTVLAVTVVLVGGAAAAAYAALTTQAQRDATAAAPPQAAPTVAAPPATPAPAPAPAQPQAEQDTPTVKAPKSDAADVPAPTAAGDAAAGTPSTPAPAAPAPSTPSTPSSGSTGTGGGTGDQTSTAPVAIDLPAKAARLYDPFGRAAGAKPANAVDGKQSTALQLPVDAADGTVRAGVTLSLDKVTTLSDLTFQADTPGFTVEVYATRDAQIPPDVLDARWEHVANRRDVGVEETVALDGKFRHVLLWVTEQPADTKVAIPEVQLLH